MSHVKDVFKSLYMGVTKDGRSVYRHPDKSRYKLMYATGEQLKDKTEWYHHKNHKNMHDSRVKLKESQYEKEYLPRTEKGKAHFIGYTEEEGHPIWSDGFKLAKHNGEKYLPFDHTREKFVFGNNAYREHRMASSMASSMMSSMMSPKSSAPYVGSLNMHTAKSLGLPLNKQIGKKNGKPVYQRCRAIYENGKFVPDHEPIDTTHGDKIITDEDHILGYAGTKLVIRTCRYGF